MSTERTYNYPAKNAVRKAWMQFLPSSFASPALTRGLYLPGHTNFELSGYLEKGLQAQNLIGVEHDETIFDRISLLGSGIELVKGSIKDAVEQIASRGLHPVTFANFDFDGSCHTFIEDVLSVFRIFPTKDSAYLSVSSYMARDDEAVLQGMVNTSKFYSVFESATQFWTAYGRMMDRYTALRRQLPGSSVEDHAHLSRELGFLWWIALVMGCVDYQDGHTWSVKQSSLELYEDILREITVRARERIGDAGEFRVLSDSRLGERLRQRSCYLWPDRFEHFVWFTAQRQPMRTWMIRLEPFGQNDVRPTHFEIVEQLWNMATKTPLVYFDHSGTKISFD